MNIMNENDNYGKPIINKFVLKYIILNKTCQDKAFVTKHIEKLHKIY
jgi:hypothetical protein